MASQLWGSGYGRNAGLLGRVGTLEKSGQILEETINKIKSGEVDPNRVTKTVLVIDQAQDMDADEFALIKAYLLHSLKISGMKAMLKRRILI